MHSTVTTSDVARNFDSIALIGGLQNCNAVRYRFNGRTLVCSPTWRVRGFHLIISIAILGGLGRMLYVLYSGQSINGFQTGEKVALVTAALFIPILLLQIVWAVLYERSFTWDFPAGTIAATRRDFGRRRQVQFTAAEVASVETTIIQRLLKQDVGSNTLDCYCLNLELNDGRVLHVLESTDKLPIIEVADIIRQQSQLPVHNGIDR